MEKVSFLIFIPDGKKFHLTPNWLLGTLWIITVAFLYFFGTEGVPPGAAAFLWLVGLGLVTIFYLLASFFTYKPLNGALNGEIEFEKDKIIINEKIFELSDMKEIDFSFGDFYGQSIWHIYSDFNPGRSRGVDNHMQFIDNDDQNWIIDFQIQSEHGHLELAPFIKEAVRARKMPRQRGVDLVGSENLSV